MFMYVHLVNINNLYYVRHKLPNQIVGDREKYFVNLTFGNPSKMFLSRHNALATHETICQHSI